MVANLVLIPGETSLDTRKSIPESGRRGWDGGNQESTREEHGFQVDCVFS